jgi:hypothetical protein
MKFQAKGGADFEPVPAGNHLAICNGVVDFGLQPGSTQFPEPKHQVYIRFELPQERIKFERDGKKIEGPMSIGRRFTASMSKKANLRKFIESWFGKPFSSDEAAADFDLAKLINAKCLLNVTHVQRETALYANITGASPIPKGMPSNFSRENPILLYDLDQHSDDSFKDLPEWMMNVINARLEPQPKKTNGAAKSAGRPTGNAPGFDPSNRIVTTDTGLPTGENATFDDEIPY